MNRLIVLEMIKAIDKTLEKLGRISSEFHEKLHPVYCSDFKLNFGGLEEPYSGSIDGFFENQAGEKVPVFSHYRYGINRGWLYFPELATLSQLSTRNLVPQSDREFLKKAVGTRTITLPLAEIRHRSLQRAKEISQEFIPSSFEESDFPVLLPDDSYTSGTIDSLVKLHTRLLKKIRASGCLLSQKPLRVLEVGFTSGGHSVFAFEKLGVECYAIDNAYGTQEKRLPPLVGYLNQKLKSKATFAWGDVTERIPFEDKSFDLIYSASTLEHIQDIPKALAEMRRVLKDDGIIAHNYYSFFCYYGGHALGVWDSPWGHARLRQEEYFHYLQDWRPEEAKEATTWMETCLNPSLTIREMQRGLYEAGFKIINWEQYPSDFKILEQLTPEIIHSCMKAYPQIDVADLVVDGIYFLATKFSH